MGHPAGADHAPTQEDHHERTAPSQGRAALPEIRTVRARRKAGGNASAKPQFKRALDRGTIRFVNRDTIDALQRDWSEQRPDLDPEPMGVVLRIQALAKILGEQTAARLQEYDLQWWQYDVLSTLRRQGAPFTLPATGLAESAMLTSGAMTNRIDRLEEEGLVRRLKDDADRRKVLVQLTDKGLKLIESATEARFETAMDALESLSARQRNALSDLLRMVLMSQED
jgi:DNA-binding MarR family transcriptional regulator